MILLYPEPNLEGAELVQLVHSVCKQNLVPFVLEDEKKEFFRRSIFDSLKTAGLTALLLPRKWGGKEKTAPSYYRVIMELARFSASYSITVGVHQMIQDALLNFGTDEQKNQYLTGLVSGNLLGAFSLSESGSGSDAASIRTSARPSTKGFILNGTKAWCSNGADADLFLVMARTGDPGAKGISAFLIPKNTPGFRVGKKEKKLGLSTSSLTELIFENCEVPKTALLSQEGDGFKIALSQLDAGRIGIASTAVGLAFQALETIWSLGISQQIPHFNDGVKAEWAEKYALLQAVFSQLMLTADLRDRGNKVTSMASQCKLLASDLAMEMTSFAVETAGLSGVFSSFGLERLMRDAKALQIVEGTNQIQKLVLSRELEKMVGQ